MTLVDHDPRPVLFAATAHRQTRRNSHTAQADRCCTHHLRETVGHELHPVILRASVPPAGLGAHPLHRRHDDVQLRHLLWRRKLRADAVRQLFEIGLGLPLEDADLRFEEDDAVAEVCLLLQLTLPLPLQLLRHDEQRAAADRPDVLPTPLPRP